MAVSNRVPVPHSIALFVTLLVTLVSSVSGCDREGPDHVDVSKRDIVVIVLDTVRKDRLSTYGYARNTSPNLDWLSKASRRFTNAYATSSWTTPSHAELTIP